MGRKRLMTVLKLQIPAGAASPAPPVGPALGQHGVNIMEFCKAFNAATQGARIEKGSAIPHKEKVGSVTKAQVREIAETKMPDLNANDIENAMLIIEGTARSMGLDVVDA